MAFDLLCTDLEQVEGNLQMVKCMSIFVHQAPSAIDCTFMKTLFTSVAIANRTLMALIYATEKY